MAVKKKAAPKKKAPAKKATAKKPAAKKAVAKKPAAKKAVAKKPAAKKVAAKKPAAKKVAVKKPVAKKAVAKKAVAKKTATVKAPVKKVTANKKLSKKTAPAAKKPTVAFIEMAKVEILEMVSEPKKTLAKSTEKKAKAEKNPESSLPEKKEGQVTLEENEFLHLKMAKAKHENPRAGHPEEGEEQVIEHPPLSPIVRETPKVGRNEPCPCGSGLKYKKCHGKA